MRRMLALAVFVVVMVFVLGKDHLADAPPAAVSTVTFGFLLLAAYLVGDALSWIKLPKITGYIAAGMLFGPFVLNLITRSTLQDLKLIDDMALTFIALAAGGELRIAALRQRQKAILWTVICQTVIVSIGVGTVAYFSRGLMPFLAGFPNSHQWAVCLLLGALAVARSPSSAIAVISECKARGPFTEMTLGVTVVADILVIALFAMVVSFSQSLLQDNHALDFFLILGIAGELITSVIAGILLGLALSRTVSLITTELPVLILGASFLVTFFSRLLADFLSVHFDLSFHLEPMLICMTAGLWVQNFSKGGDLFMEKIDRSALPVFVIFFALTGAALNLDALRQTWILAILLVVVRAGLILIGGYAGARIAGDPPEFQKTSGWAFITQAGVSLGLAGMIIRRFPDWGHALATAVVAVIAINQIIGPVALKYALVRVGESGRRHAGRDITPPVDDADRFSA